MTEEQKFKEIPELLDQLDALSEFYPLPTAVWKDIRKLMFLSYDEGYTKGFKVGHDAGWELNEEVSHRGL